MRNFRSQFTYLLAGPRVWQRVLISKFCNYFVNYSYILKYMLQLSRPRWSWGNVLASRSKVCGFKPGWGLWIFSRCKNCEHKPSGRDFKLGVPNLIFQARFHDDLSIFQKKKKKYLPWLNPEPSYFKGNKYHPPGGTLSCGSRVRDFRLVKEPQAWKNRSLSKI